MQYSGLPLGQLEAYAYLLDFGNTATTPAGAFFQSTQTYGARFHGKYAVMPKTKLIYGLEYAYQSDYQNNPSNISSHYILGELGGNYEVGGPIKSVTLKVNYELLSGDDELLSKVVFRRLNQAAT